MKKFFALAFLLAFLAPFVPAAPVSACDTSACTTPVGATTGSTGSTTNNSTTNNNVGGSTTNVTANPNNAQTTNSSAVANPLGQNTNVQINNQNSGQLGWGPGVVCPTTSISANVYNANQAYSGYPGSSTTGFGVGVVIPLNSRGVLDDCAHYGNLITKRAAFDNTIGRMKSCADLVNNYHVDTTSAAYVALCPDVRIAVAQPQIIEKRVEVPQPYAVPGPERIKVVDVSKYAPPACLPDYDRDKDLALLHSMRHQLHTYHQTPEFVALHKKLSKACNVTSAQILTALDGEGD